MTFPLESMPIPGLEAPEPESVLSDPQLPPFGRVLDVTTEFSIQIAVAFPETSMTTDGSDASTFDVEIVVGGELQLKSAFNCIKDAIAAIKK